MSEHRIEQDGPLLDDEGRLRECGYAFSPILDYSRSQVKAPAWRIKEWDYYLVNDERYAVALTFSDLGYIGLISASVMDLEAKSDVTATQITPMPLGRMGLPASSETGDIAWSSKRSRVEFSHKGPARRLSFAMQRFDGEKDLEVELLLTDEPRDSMVIATPWKEDPLAFYYNRKVVGMRAKGAFRVGDMVHEFDEKKALGLLDWGRGVWTYDNTWYWAVAQGFADGHVVGLNLGYGFGDTSAASENMLFVDGVAHKLGRCDMGLLKTSTGAYRYMEPWHMHEEAGRIDLVFTPEIDRNALIDVAGILRTEQHQIFGLLNGHVVLDDGSTLELRDLRCAAERVHNKY